MNTCLESYPCQHYVTYNNGVRSNMDGKSIVTYAVNNNFPAHIIDNLESYKHFEYLMTDDQKTMLAKRICDIKGYRVHHVHHDRNCCQ